MIAFMSPPSRPVGDYTQAQGPVFLVSDDESCSHRHSVTCISAGSDKVMTCMGAAIVSSRWRRGCVT